jgi:hypothetical protein
MFEDVKHVGALMEEQTIRTTLDGDAEEVVKRLEVLHGWRAEMVWRSSSALDVVRMISST